METLGDFELYRDQPIGKGGGGEVYKGKQISLNRPVAIKFLTKELSDDESFIRRFRREAECLAKLADEHIIQVYGAGEHQGNHYFAMEYVPGLSLTKFIERHYKFSFDDVIHIGLAVAKALKTAWECPEQIVHRDIKPSNVMITFPQAILDMKKLDMKEARIKVMDFGLARTVKTAHEDTDLTMAGTIMGTAKYISPEQALGKKVDIRSDIYSLGIMLYEIATGQLPFTGETPLDFLQHHINTAPPLPRAINQQIPLELEGIIIKCIRKQPAERYRNPSELLDDLESLRQKQKPLYARPTGGLTHPQKTTRKRTGRLILLILLLIISISSYLIITHQETLQSFINPNTEPAAIGEPSPENILDDGEVKVIGHMNKDINNPFDYGIQIKVFIENMSQEVQMRILRVELNWSGKTYFKTRQLNLSPKSSNTVDIDFYEPTAGEQYYTYKIVLRK